jgi:uncharacterized protein with von Willebrand factor type A (vWA) domain
LRADGVEVGPGRLQDAVRGLDLVDLTNRAEVYHALRCTMVSRHDDIAPFDTAFRAYWEQPEDGGLELGLGMPEPERRVAPAHSVGEREVDVDDDEDEPPAAAVYSATELLRRRDFADMSSDELLACRAVMVELARSQPMRRSRRLRPDSSGRVLDQRRTLRAAMRTHGMPLERSWRRHKLVPRKVVFLCDVSGSMEPYARAMVMFLQAMTQAGRRVEAFAFGTRLTRLTPYLSGRDPGAALRVAAAAMPDWGGGTRIGESLAAYNSEYGRASMTRGAVVVIVSDGWERGGLDRLDAELARIERSAHLLVWVNPLKGHAGFEPLAGGMRIALDHADLFLEGHNLNAIGSLAEALAAVS